MHTLGMWAANGVTHRVTTQHGPAFGLTMGAKPQHRRPWAGAEAFPTALRRLHEALAANPDEGQLAESLCLCVEQAPGVSACALYLDGRLAAFTGNWEPGRAGDVRMPLSAGSSVLGSLHLAISGPRQWSRCEPYAACAVQLVAARIENLRQRHRPAQPQAPHELMRYIIEHVRSGVAVLDRDLRYLHVSRRFLDEVKLREPDVIGKRHYDVFPEIPESWKEVHRRALQGEILSAEADPFERSDGTLYWTRWECRPWYEAGGAIGGIVLYTEVINERIQAQEEHRKLQAQLVQAQKMESIGRLAGGVAHDFNNLLTIINGYCNIAIEQVSPGTPLRAELEEIRKSGERAAALTGQLLAFSRKQALRPSLVDLNQIVRGMEPMLPRLMGERVRVTVRPDANPVAVVADQHQLEQVIMNLAANARDAMREGGEFYIETARIELDQAAAKLYPSATPGAYVVLAVRDTGVGMDEETRLRIFEPFFTTKMPGQGTGLGLSMVYGIVAQSGGFIDVSSKPGEGTIFRVHLPAADGPARSSESQTDAEVPRGDATVLVVEDQEEVRTFTAAALRSYGYRVVTSASAAEALAICTRPDRDVDLVLTDIIMPETSGRELAAKLSGLRIELPVLFMSGYMGEATGDQEHLDEALLLKKPFSPAELARKVSAALRSRQKGAG